MKMHKYFIKTPWWARAFFSAYVWRIPTSEKIVYLSFDDGPHPTITPWVLDELKKYNARATFFCIGDNVIKYPSVYQRVLAEGHSVGNHTFHHLNGWKSTAVDYLNDAAKAASVIKSNLFRPPYGKITAKQAKGLPYALTNESAKVIMWDVLSADFDTSITPQQCTKNVLENTEPGSVIVFHDSQKAFRNLQAALPGVLTALEKKGYTFKEMPMDIL
jgi:peptidoglycan/xylan/chitin deacetylase (PgdA/CDA1 family)